jgi:hypothetical protein
MTDKDPNELRAPADIEVVVAWDDAVTAFLDRGSSGAHWPGGEHNKLLLLDKIFSLGLEDAGDKHAVLTIAFDELRRDGVLQPPADAED